MGILDTPAGDDTPEIWTALSGISKDPVITEYTISEHDVKGPFLKKLPAKMEAMKNLKALSYTSPREAIVLKKHAENPRTGKPASPDTARRMLDALTKEPPS